LNWETTNTLDLGKRKQPGQAARSSPQPSASTGHGADLPHVLLSLMGTSIGTTLASTDA
jgi:hypothetical protein